MYGSKFQAFASFHRQNANWSVRGERRVVIDITFIAGSNDLGLAGQINIAFQVVEDSQPVILSSYDDAESVSLPYEVSINPYLFF